MRELRIYEKCLRSIFIGESRMRIFYEVGVLDLMSFLKYRIGFYGLFIIASKFKPIFKLNPILGVLS